MGCRCCRMIKSYIYDPSVAVDVRKSDSAGSSLYQPHYLPGGGPGADPLGGHDKQKQGIHNLGYSKSSDGAFKLEADNNHVNQRLHAAPTLAREPRLHGSALQGSAPADGGLYIIQPDSLGSRWLTDKSPSQVPVYPDIQGYGGRPATPCGNSSADEADEGVGGTPEYPCDTEDEGSVLSVDVHTSTTSLSSADTRDGRRPPKTPDVSTVESGISVTKSEDEEEDEEVQSVTDSMVAEALAALEAATAGEDFE